MPNTPLESFIRRHLEQADLLLMTHLVLGYPSFEDNLRLIETMTKHRVPLIELQIPFSEPTADGPVIAGACQQSIANGTDVAQCLDFARTVCARFPDTAFLFMTYANIPYRIGFDAFAKTTAGIGIKGLIIPDLPPEHGADYEAACAVRKLGAVYIFTPNAAEQRIAYLAQHASGLVYCVGRTGVTGGRTDFTAHITARAQLYRRHTPLPLAMGFGISGAADLAVLRGHFDIGVIGTQILRLYDREGADGVSRFLSSLLPG